ncbi:MAG: hypothetical protein SAJ12_06240 [Jaaginema sp. PMC 1079.18]|nr:hypothetical protein [Jaaginema sp. PMC 1080.18]MEC4850592.1 hypothetical protein [Jaaginema sp. PMC 1079.18]MEC4865389.1 hypothetical protein [Jaaginema sp. PMC 1078.18]
MFEQVPHPDRKPPTAFPASRQENRLTSDRSRWLAFGLYLSVASVSSGCSISSSTTPALPTAAAQTPGTNLVSPVVNVSTVEWDDLLNVCDGQGAIATDPYPTQDTPSQRNLVFAHRDVSQDESFGLYDSHLFTRTWQPLQPEKAQLVVCISENQRYEQIESCTYQKGRYTLYRYRNTIEVQLREANTGDILDQTTLSSEARHCPTHKPIGDEREWHWSGQLPDVELYAWLKPYLHEATSEKTTAGEDRPSRPPLARSTATEM